MPAIKDIKGQRFGNLIVESFNRVEKRKTHWNCVCDCGNNVIATSGNLKSGNTSSCGCGRTKHSMCDKRIYRIWKNMKNRCVCPSASHFDRYGGRGISCTSEWEKFENFYEWSTSNGYTDKLTLDRINNDGNYEPDNCRWVTMKAQMSNTKSNICVEANGKKQTIKKWSEELGINYNTLRNRYKLGDRGERFIRPLETKYSPKISN